MQNSTRYYLREITLEEFGESWENKKLFIVGLDNKKTEMPYYQFEKIIDGLVNRVEYKMMATMALFIGIIITLATLIFTIDGALKDIVGYSSLIILLPIILVFSSIIIYFLFIFAHYTLDAYTEKRYGRLLKRSDKEIIRETFNA